MGKQVCASQRGDNVNDVWDDGSGLLPYEPEAPFKVCVFGSRESGVSSLVVRFASDVFKEGMEFSMYDETYRKLISMQNGPVMIEVFDRSPEENLNPSYYSRSTWADGFLFCYSLVANPNEELDHLRELYSRTCRIKDMDKIRCVIVGMKSDSWQGDSSPPVGAAFADEVGAPHIVTSAKNNVNIAEAFASLVEVCFGLSRITSTKSAQRT